MNEKQLQKLIRSAIETYRDAPDDVSDVELSALIAGAGPFTPFELGWFERGIVIDLNHRGIAV